MKIKSLPIIIILILILPACGSWQKTSTITYISVGEVLKSIGSSAKSMCKNGTLSTAECEDIGDQYDLARENYLIAGDMLSDAIELEMAIDEKEYNIIMSVVSSILNHINLVIERNR